jgi:hypothetical protein
MSNKPAPTDEEQKINRRSFIIGICIGLAFIILFTILYFAGLIKG